MQRYDWAARPLAMTLISLAVAIAVGCGDRSGGRGPHVDPSFGDRAAGCLLLLADVDHASFLGVEVRGERLERARTKKRDGVRGHVRP